MRSPSLQTSFAAGGLPLGPDFRQTRGDVGAVPSLNVSVRAMPRASFGISEHVWPVLLWVPVKGACSPDDVPGEDSLTPRSVKLDPNPNSTAL